MPPWLVWAQVPTLQAAARLLQVPLPGQPSPEAFSCRKATHRGQRLHVGARQTEVADHVENPVVGGQVQGGAAILQDTEAPEGSEDGARGWRASPPRGVWDPPERSRRRGLLLQKLASPGGGKPSTTFSSVFFS